jgi:hypothetical protein
VDSSATRPTCGCSAGEKKSRGLRIARANRTEDLRVESSRTSTALFRSNARLFIEGIGPFVYRLEDTAFSRRGGGFDSLTGCLNDRVWESLVIRLPWEQEIAGSNPAALILGRRSIENESVCVCDHRPRDQ